LGLSGNAAESALLPAILRSSSAGERSPAEKAGWPSAGPEMVDSSGPEPGRPAVVEGAFLFAAGAFLVGMEDSQFKGEVDRRWPRAACA